TWGGRNFSMGGAGGKIDTNGNDQLIDGVFSVGGPFTKIGNGILTLSGTNTHTGTETAAGGVLLAAKPASLPGYTTAGKVIANSGATVGARVGGAGEWASTDVDTLGSNATWNAGS